MKIIVFVVILVWFQLVHGERERSSRSGSSKDSSKPVRAGVQKVASVFFGCPGIASGDANVTCTNKIQKLTKGVNCAVKVPLGTKASFTCPSNYMQKGNITTIQCRFPGKWNNIPITCVPSGSTNSTVKPTNATSATTTAAAANTSATTTTAAAATTTTVAETSKETTTEPTTTPIPEGYSRPYEGSNPMKAHTDPVNRTTAEVVCHREGAELLELSDNKKREAVFVMLGTAVNTTEPLSGIMIYGKYRESDQVFLNSTGGIITDWCPGEPTNPASEKCLSYRLAPEFKCINNIPCEMVYPFICEIIVTTHPNVDNSTTPTG